jgi:hypothetical protein
VGLDWAFTGAPDHTVADGAKLGAFESALTSESRNVGADDGISETGLVGGYVPPMVGA